MRPFFIVGCPRSGTTLLQQILTRHPEVVIPPETAFFTKLLSRWPGRFRRQLARIESDLEIELPGARRPRGSREAAALFERIASAYAERAGRPAARWFGDKTPDHLRHLQAILDALPDAHFVSITRDGRDVALSLSKVPWAPSDVQVGFGIWLESAKIQIALADRPPAGLLQVRYEDLASSPETEVRRIAEHLELDYSDRLLSESAAPRGIPERERGWKDRAHRTIDPERVGVWRRELDARQVGRMERWGGFALAELGYGLSTEPPTGRPGSADLATRLRWARWRARAVGRLLLGRD